MQGVDAAGTPGGWGIGRHERGTARIAARLRGTIPASLLACPFGYNLTINTRCNGQVTSDHWEQPDR